MKFSDSCQSFIVFQAEIQLAWEYLKPVKVEVDISPSFAFLCVYTSEMGSGASGKTHGPKALKLFWIQLESRLHRCVCSSISIFPCVIMAWVRLRSNLSICKSQPASQAAFIRPSQRPYLAPRKFRSSVFLSHIQILRKKGKVKMCPKIWIFPWFSRRRTWISFFHSFRACGTLNFRRNEMWKPKFVSDGGILLATIIKNGKLLKIKKRRRERVRESAGGERSWREKWKWWKNFQWKMYGENGENFSFYAFHLDRRKKSLSLCAAFLHFTSPLDDQPTEKGQQHATEREIKCQ